MDKETQKMLREAFLNLRRKILMQYVEQGDFDISVVKKEAAADNVRKDR